MEVCIVVEGEFDKFVVRQCLPPALRAYVRFFVGGGVSSALSFARSLILTRNLPVYLILDTDATNQVQIDEQRVAYSNLLSMVAIDTPFGIGLFAPTLEILFFTDSQSLEDVLQVKIDQLDLVRSTYEPKKVLDELLGRSPLDIKSKGLC